MLVSLLKKFGLKFSLNDPRWGRGSDDNNKNQDNKRPNDGPPDLDQLWRDFNQRLSGIFGNRKNGGGGNGGDSSGGGMGGFKPDMRGAGIGAAIIAGIVAFLWLVSGFFIVQEGQTGVVMTFGKYSHMTPAGFNWRWPTPIQSHEIVNVSQVRTVEVGYRGNVKNKQQQESLMLTEDENIIDIQFAVQYTLKNASDWVFNNREQEEMVKQVAETAIREVVGRSKMDFVLYEGREKIAFDSSQLMQQIVDRYKSGVQITNVTMQGVQPPEQVQAAFDDAVKAGQDRERQKNEGQAYANDVIPRARGAASRLLQESEAYRSSVTANAQGEASRFKQVLVEYQKAPAVTRDRMYLETMQKIFSSTTKVMVDSKGNNSLIYLPLDKLISQSAAPAGAAADVGAIRPPATSSTSAPDTAALEAQESRSRDSRSSRDREVR
ncbi:MULTISPECIES: FtsH protease activity modulator HflK [Oxalobacteraceae]|uniref:Protein HflK n=1 Tax=Herminiimonas contaminans TaxID=1111140 RepID=A0ABS0EPD4_9BURK|nr:MULTISPECIES: FtsH protease activity modulator HflK [Oxalobacteraceae]MBF8176570.1 FtsH protease activity modulator HflK [Herminiimonas contaminans]